MRKTVAEEVTKEQQPTEQSVQPQPVEGQQKKSFVGLVVGIVNFILILALAGAGFYLFQDIKDKQAKLGQTMDKDDLRAIETSKQFNAYQNQLATMQSQIATFNEEIVGKDNHFNDTLAGFSKLHQQQLEQATQRLQDQIDQLKRQLGKTRGDWLLADAEYLLSIANQRLHLAGDVTTTKMALEAADQRLRESGDAAAFKVREQIAREIAGLKSVTMPDIVGLFASIQLLKDKVKTLAVILPYAGKPLTESKQIHNHAVPQDSEHGLLNSTLNALEGYVTVKHSDQPVTKILTHEEVDFIKQQLNVKLELIKIALVQQNDALFQSNIADAKKWLQANFTNNKHSNYFVTELNKLKGTSLRVQLPDISQSLKLLRDITKLRIEMDKAHFKPQKNLSTQQAVIAPVSP